MPELEDITYSRQATIASVTDYYDFLTKLFLKDSQVIHPPAGGWPCIVNADPNTLESLGKSAEVLSLLAHLPYIHDPNNWNDEADGAPSCHFADWQGLIAGLNSPLGSSIGDELRLITEGSTFAALAPRHVVGLTCGSRENPVMVLDTRLGIIHWEDCPSSIEMGYYSTTVDYDPKEDEYEEDDEGDEDDEDDENDEGDEGDNQDDENDNGNYDGDDDFDDDFDDERTAAVLEKEAAWRQGATAWAIPDFVENLKDQFRKLHWIPISHYTIWSAEWSNALEDKGMIPMLRDIYHQHGWPDSAHYRKSECLEAVLKAMKERYPSSADPKEE